MLLRILCIFVMILTVLSGGSPVWAGQSTLKHLLSEDWATPLSETEMAEMRGGFNGLAFSVFFTGFYDKLGNVAGNLNVDNGGATTPTPMVAPQPTIAQENGEVKISTNIGNFNGASGIFQIAQVPGNFNVVHNQLFVQIAVVNVLNGSSVPSLASLFGR